MENKKGFFQILKQKPTTLEEAKQKTKNFCILMGVIFLVFSVLAALLHIFFGIIMLIGCGIILAVLYFKENQKNKRNFCKECGARIDYESGVEWEVTGFEEKDFNPNPNSNSKQIIKKKIAIVEFTCTCEDCGATRTFSQKYDAIIWYDNGTRKDNNIETMAKNYFKI